MLNVFDLLGRLAQCLVYKSPTISISYDSPLIYGDVILHELKVLGHDGVRMTSEQASVYCERLDDPLEGPRHAIATLSAYGTHFLSHFCHFYYAFGL